MIPHVSNECIDLIMKMLIYDPEQRITASEALRHEYFRDLKEIDSLKQFQKTLYVFIIFIIFQVLLKIKLKDKEEL